MSNKFDILDALDDESEALLERFNDRLSPICWSKAALLAIADVVQQLAAPDAPAKDMEARVQAAISMAIKAFEQFPWQLSELVEQAPDLYQAVLEACPDTAFADQISKRSLVKICKDIAYGS